VNRSDVILMNLAAKKAVEVTKQMLEQEAALEYAEQGTAPSWRGRDFTVSSAVKQGGPAIVDDAAFLAWVERSYPSEVETVRRVRPAYVSAILAQAARLAAPCDSDGTLIPGMAWRDGGEFSHLAVKPSADLRARLDAFGVAIIAGEFPFALPAVDA
jgi:hypothetical protein